MSIRHFLQRCILERFSKSEIVVEQPTSLFSLPSEMLQKIIGYSGLYIPLIARVNYQLYEHVKEMKVNIHKISGNILSTPAIVDYVFDVLKLNKSSQLLDYCVKTNNIPVVKSLIKNGCLDRTNCRVYYDEKKFVTRLSYYIRVLIENDDLPNYIKLIDLSLFKDDGHLELIIKTAIKYDRINTFQYFNNKYEIVGHSPYINQAIKYGRLPIIKILLKSRLHLTSDMFRLARDHKQPEILEYLDTLRNTGRC